MARQDGMEERRSVYQDIREQIHELIRKGELRVGDKLPSERRLAEQFGASRNSVREAIRTLAENQVLESRHGDGTYILSQDHRAGMERLRNALEKRKRRVREIFEFRRILEPQVAFLAARHITRAQIDRLKVLVFEQERRIISGQGDSDLDVDFHLVLARGTKNTVLVEVLRTLNDILSETSPDTLQTEERRRASLRTHVLIVDALEKRDPEAAKQAMNLHLEEIEELVLRAELT
jgi:GntR family transcriptional regulator, transcriptional repressor for pyruvate dehydrogenase complex